MKLKTLPCLFACVFSAQNAFANNLEIARAQLDDVLVSATRVKEDVDSANRPVSTVDRAELDTLAPQSVGEALRFQPNLSVVGGPRSGSQEVNIRGLQGEKVLQTVDGVRQVFESGHRPNYFLDPELIKSIEVVKGPASSLWGSGAIGGVVAQNTIDGIDLLRGNSNLGGYAKLGRNANSNQLLGSAAVGGRGEQSDWLLAGYHRDADNLKLGNGQRLSNSAFRTTGFLGKFNYHLDEEQTIRLGYREAEVKGGVPSNGTANVNPTSNFLINRDQATRNLQVGYEKSSPNGDAQTGLIAYWNQVEMNEARQADNRPDSTMLDVLGFSFVQARQFDALKLQYGFDGYQEDFSAARAGTNRPVPPDGLSTVYGAYLKGVYQLSAPWAIELGARYDQFEARAENLGLAREDSDVSPSAALIWKATESTKLTLRHDRAFRSPGAEELFSTGTHFCITPTICNRFVPNPNLRPEKAANTELIVNSRFDGLLGSDAFTLTGSLFQNKVRDFIEQVVTGPSFTSIPPNGGTSTWVNVNRATLEGAELAATYTRGDLDLTFGYGQVRGRDDITGNDLRNIPATTLSMDARYAFIPQRFTAGVRVLGVERQDNTNLATPGTAPFGGYGLIDLYASYKPASLKNVTFDFVIKNAGDKHYRQAWAEIDSVGREAILSAKIEF